MDFMIALGTCSLAKDFALALALLTSFSHGEPYTVRAREDVLNAPFDDAATDDTGAPAASDPHTKRDALAQMRRLARAHPLVGLFPVPLTWARLYHVRHEDLLDPCINVSIATARLSEFEAECTGRESRGCALRKYVEAAGIEPFEDAVLEMLRELDLPPGPGALVETEEVLSAPVFVPEADPDGRAFGADRVFIREEASRHSQSRVVQPRATASPARSDKRADSPHTR